MRLLVCEFSGFTEAAFGQVPPQFAHLKARSHKLVIKVGVAPHLFNCRSSAQSMLLIIIYENVSMCETTTSIHRTKYPCFTEFLL